MNVNLSSQTTHIEGVEPILTLGERNNLLLEAVRQLGGSILTSSNTVTNDSVLANTKRDGKKFAFEFKTVTSESESILCSSKLSDTTSEC